MLSDMAVAGLAVGGLKGNSQSCVAFLMRGNWEDVTRPRTTDADAHGRNLPFLFNNESTLLEFTGSVGFIPCWSDVDPLVGSWWRQEPVQTCGCVPTNRTSHLLRQDRLSCRV